MPHKRNTPGSPCCCLLFPGLAGGAWQEGWEAARGELPEFGPTGAPWAIREQNQIYCLKSPSSSPWQVLCVTVWPDNPLWQPVGVHTSDATLRVYVDFQDEDNWIGLDVRWQLHVGGVTCYYACTASLLQCIDGSPTTLDGPISSWTDCDTPVDVVLVTDGTRTEAVVLADYDRSRDLTLAAEHAAASGTRAGIGTHPSAPLLNTDGSPGTLFVTDSTFEQCLCCRCANDRAPLVLVADLTTPTESLELIAQRADRYRPSGPYSHDCELQSGCVWTDADAETTVTVQWDQEQTQTTIEVARTVSGTTTTYRLVDPGRVDCRALSDFTVPYYSGPLSGSTCKLTASYLA